MAGRLGYGLILKVGANPAAVTATVTLGGLTNIPPPPFSREMVDVTAHDSPGGFREFIGGLKDPGEFSPTLNWIPGDATDLVLIAMQAENEPRLFEWTAPQVSPDRICTFRGLLSAWEPTGEVEGALTASITLRVTSVPVWSVGGGGT